MGTRLQWIGCTSLALGLFAAIAPGHAQSARPWVDPPPDAAATSSHTPSSPAANEFKPAAPQPADTSAGVKPSEAGKEKVKLLTKEASTAPVKNPPRKIAAERKERRQVRSAATSNGERSRQTTQPRELVGASPQGTRAARVQEGLNAGLEVMTLRTIEFPDGRRVQILTRPQPETVSRLMDAPY